MGVAIVGETRRHKLSRWEQKNQFRLPEDFAHNSGNLLSPPGSDQGVAAPLARQTSKNCPSGRRGANRPLRSGVSPA